MYCEACGFVNTLGREACESCEQPLVDPAAEEAPVVPGGFNPPVGTVLAGYRIEKLLGAGATGSVFLANQLRLDRPAALKVLTPEKAESARTLERFETEASLLASLRHPGVVAVYDIFRHEGLLCIAMEHVGGGSVRDLLKDKLCLPEQQAASIARQAAEGLAEAGSQGIVHRDVKPDNLLLSHLGKVKIADFGLARGGRANELDSQGKVVGSLPYMAPEQCRNSDKVDPRSDLYALGCTLFEMLVGETPFRAVRAREMMEKHILEEPPLLRSRRGDISPQMEALVKRLLAKDPAERFQDGLELAEALKPLEGVSASSAETPAHSPRRARRKSGRGKLAKRMSTGASSGSVPRAKRRRGRGGGGKRSRGRPRRSSDSSVQVWLVVVGVVLVLILLLLALQVAGVF